MINKYQKKAVVVEAAKVTNDSILEVAKWCGGISFVEDGRLLLLIFTLEGTMRAEIGDYIIKGVKGEFYPCKSDIFAATYDPVEGPHA